MGVIITPQVEIDRYFDSERVSQSVLKDLEKGFNHFVAKQIEKEEAVMNDKENQSFLIGSAVDCILTGEEGEFEKQYYVSEIENKPSDVEMLIVKDVFDMSMEDGVPTSLELEELVQPLNIAITTHNWYKGNPGPTRIATMVGKSSEYFNDLKKAFGKTILSGSQRFIIDKIVNSLKSNAKTAHYFDRGMFMRSSDVDVYYQLPIYFTHRGVECKALLDMLIVFRNPETGQVQHVQPVDLKTMHGNTIKFLYSVKQWRYDIQAAWYTLAISKYLEAVFPNIEVIIKPFLFVVESTTNIGTPLVYKMDEVLLMQGAVGRQSLYASDLNKDIGGFEIVLSKEIRGYESLIDEYIYYVENEWNEDKEISKNEKEGILTIDWNGIK